MTWSSPNGNLTIIILQNKMFKLVQIVQAVQMWKTECEHYTKQCKHGKRVRVQMNLATKLDAALRSRIFRFVISEGDIIDKLD